MVWDIPEQKEEEVNVSKNLFTPLKDEAETSGYNVLVYGSFGVGKSHFCLTAPGTVFIIDTERGMKPLLKNFPDKEINTLLVFGKSAKETYENVEKALIQLEQKAEKGEVGTIIFDSITDFWEVCQTYCKEELWKIKDTDRLKSQWDWNTISKKYYRILRRLLLLNCNFIATAREGEVYAGAGQPTGSFKPRAEKNTEHWLNIVIHMNSKIVNNNYQFISTIKKCKELGKLQGKSFNNLDFNKLKEEIEHT